jgi:uncharacterized RDD family membrane protein YckC
MLGGYPGEAYDVPAVHSLDTTETDWSTLRYAPHERRTPGGARYAPWWQRVSAFLIDVSAVLTAVLTVAAPIFVLAGFRDSDPSHGEAAWLTAALFSAALVVGAAYAIVFEGRSGQTWGKRAVGLMVLAEDGSPCGYGRAASRELLGRVLIGGFAWLLVLPGMLSYLAALWDPERQTWHDRIGQTIVVRVEHAGQGSEHAAGERDHVPEPAGDLTASQNASRLPG